MTNILTEAPAPEAMTSKYNLEIKKILVAVDLSPHSEQTAAYAIELAKPFGAYLTLVHVSSPERANELTGDKGDRFSEPAVVPEEELERLEKKIRRTHPSCSAHVCVGDPADKVALMAEILHADLIVTASHHPGFLARLFGLDQAPRIVHQAPCPVLVYQEKN